MPNVTTNGGAGIHHIGHAADGPPVLSSAAVHEHAVRRREQTRPGWVEREIAMDPRTYGKLEKSPFGQRMARHQRTGPGARTRLRGVTVVGPSCGASDLPNELLGALSDIENCSTNILVFGSARCRRESS